MLDLDAELDLSLNFELSTFSTYHGAGIIIVDPVAVGATLASAQVGRFKSYSVVLSPCAKRAQQSSASLIQAATDDDNDSQC